MSEDKIQAEFFIWAWNTFPLLRYLYFHVPNGGLRSKSEAARLQAIGVVPGVADMILTGGVKSSLMYIEFKDAKAKQSQAQREFENAAKASNFSYIVCRNSEDAKKIFCDFYGVAS